MSVTKFPRKKHLARIFSSQETLPTGSSSSNLQASFAAQDVELGTEAFRVTWTVESWNWDSMNSGWFLYKLKKFVYSILLLLVLSLFYYYYYYYCHCYYCYHYYCYFMIIVIVIIISVVIIIVVIIFVIVIIIIIVIVIIIIVIIIIVIILIITVLLLYIFIFMYTHSVWFVDVLLSTVCDLEVWDFLPTFAVNYHCLGRAYLQRWIPACIFKLQPNLLRNERICQAVHIIHTSWSQHLDHHKMALRLTMLSVQVLQF